jgi:hypothetical protein
MRPSIADFAAVRGRYARTTFRRGDAGIAQAASEMKVAARIGSNVTVWYAPDSRRTR